MLPLTWLSRGRPPMPMVKVSRKITWEVFAPTINRRCLVRKAEAPEELQPLPPLQTHHNQSLKERFPSGNYKVCSSGRLSVSQNLPLTQVSAEVELRRILTRQWRQVRPWMIVFNASIAVASSQSRQLKDIFRTVRLNTRPSS